MSIVIIAPDRDTSTLAKEIGKHLPGINVVSHPEPSNPEKVEMLVLWKHPKGIIEQFPKVRAIQSMGAGVDHIISDESIPQYLPVARIVDPNLAGGMIRYVCMAVLNFHKNLYFHLAQQEKRSWSGIKQASNTLKIGVMGMGQLGQPVAKALLALGFEVYGFSRSVQPDLGIPCYSSDQDELSTFLGKVNTIICLLPLTPATQGILDLKLFRQLPKGSFIINVGRGQHLVEADLLQAIEEGQIAGACLDVLHTEPLPQEHPFWSTPQVILTPHIASVTDQQSAAKQIAENYLRMKRGEQLLNQIDSQSGY